MRSVAVQADGGVLVGGQFDGYNGTSAGNLLRLNADGSRDATFITGTGVSGVVLSFAVQADGQELVGGSFSAYNGTTGQNNLARLTTGGGLNATATAVSGATFTFAPGGSTANPLVTTTAGSYTATARLNGEPSATSNAVVLTACTLATTMGQAAAAVQLYPNPVRGGTATLTGARPGTQVAVFDALGRGVAVATADATGTVRLVLPPGLAAGVYVVRAGYMALRLAIE